MEAVPTTLFPMPRNRLIALAVLVVVLVSLWLFETKTAAAVDAIEVLLPTSVSDNGSIQVVLSCLEGRPGISFKADPFDSLSNTLKSTGDARIQFDEELDTQYVLLGLTHLRDKLVAVTNIESSGTTAHGTQNQANQIREIITAMASHESLRVNLKMVAAIRGDEMSSSGTFDLVAYQKSIRHILNSCPS